MNALLGGPLGRRLRDVTGLLRSAARYRVGMVRALAELTRILRPAGGGLYLVSTGREEQLAMQRQIYGAARDEDVGARWREALERIQSAKVAILGVPSDVGAGFLRGANMGPAAIRAALLAGGGLPDGVVDAGDVFVVPQLLHDDMLSFAQLAATRRALYPDLAAEEAAKLPVSPLSIAERALDLLFEVNPTIAPFVIGGDHSTAWPAAAALARRAARDGTKWAIVQIDAHTDMLEERLGVKICFATWSFHASRLFDRPDKMVQLGIRASRHERAHWESTTGIRQHWADECAARPDATIDAVIAHLGAMGVERVYFSNDIDGTDASFADATGTPEPNGLTPDFVSRLIARLGAEIGLLGGDIMEVAPPIQRTPDGAKRTVDLAVRYARETIAAVR